MVREDAISSNELRTGAALSFIFVCLFMVAIYARPEDVFPSIAELHLTFLLGVCAAVSFLWCLFSGDVSLTWPRELRLVLLLTMWFAAGVPFAYWRGGSFIVLTQVWLKTALIFFLRVSQWHAGRRFFRYIDFPFGGARQSPGQNCKSGNCPCLCGSDLSGACRVLGTHLYNRGRRLRCGKHGRSLCRLIQTRAL